MPKIFVRPTRKLFLSICGCCLLLFLLFYLHATKELERPVFGLYGHRVLRAELFKNFTRTNIPDVCLKKDGMYKTKSIVFVLSEPHNIKRRQMIRSGWGQKRIGLLLGFSVLFVVGESKELHTQLKLESEIFNDVIHTSFASSRAARSLNILTAMRWATENCKQANFIVKVTDEVVVNPFGLERFLTQILSQRQSNETSQAVSDGARENQRTVEAPIKHLSTQTSAMYESVRGLQDQYSDSDFKIETSRELKQHNGSVGGIGPEARKHTEHQSDVQSTHQNIDDQKKTVVPSQTVNLVEHSHNSIYCLVWDNVTMVKTMKSRWSLDGKHREFSVNPPHCAPHGYVVPFETSKKLLSAYETDYTDDIAHWASDFYVTGILADHAHVRHVNVRDRYSSDIGDVEENTVFIPLGSDVDVISASVWKMLIEREEDVGNINGIE